MIAQHLTATKSSRPFTCGPSRPISRHNVACQAQKFEPWRLIRDAGAATMLSAALLCAGPAYADLNKFEQEMGGEFGRGSAQQYGEADVKGKDFR